MRRVLILLFLQLFALNLFAQKLSPRTTTQRQDTSRTVNADSTKKDTTKTDTTSKKPTATGLSSAVNYSAADSIKFDRKNNVVYLYGEGRIKYEEFELIADYIKLDQKNNTLFAKGATDPKSKRYMGRPIFTQGSEPPVTTDSLVFNFKNKKGKTFGTFSDVEGGFIQAAQSKKNQYNEVSIKDAIYSTCNLPHPHFGIHISRGIVTEKNIVTGPAYLMIEDIPFPVGVPFGFFPKANHRASGIMFPTFGEEAQRGFFMRDLGWYFGINDYWDATVRGSIYSKGSYEGSLAARYRKNYKYDGNLNFRYASTRLGIEGTEQFKHPSKDFNLQWSHSQKPEANPGTTFSASVNLGTGSYFSNTAAGGTYDPQQLVRNNMSSSIAYGRTFADGRINFTSSLRHDQDITSHTFNMTLPDFNLSVATFNPFDSKNRTGEQKWYQKIAVGYRLDGSNTIRTTDTALFNNGKLGGFNTGFQHQIPVSLSLNILKYLQFNSGINYTERWYLQTVRQHYTNDPTRSSQELVTETVNGFSRAYDYTLSSGFSTKLYGQANFKKGNLVAIRHVMTPSVSFNYHPDFGAASYGFYKTLIDPTTRTPTSYSIFADGVYGSPSAGLAEAIGFSLDNNIEAKVKAKHDTSTTGTGFEKIPILQGLTFNGNYNFAADSFKLSPIGFSGRTALFKQKLGINFGGQLDPYALDANGTRINYYSFRNGKLARLTNFYMAFDFSFNSTAIKKRNDDLEEQQAKPALNQQQRDELERISRDPNAFVDFNVPWNITASYNFSYAKPGNVSNITNTLNLSGDFSVTPKWKFQYTSGYDFQRNKISLTQFSIYRDLHCWDMNFSWVPFGPYRSYSVDIRVKASILQDLKLSKRRSYFDNARF